MPVVFEQPDPMGFLSGPAQAGGYVAQYNADRQYALQAAALQQHSQQANAQLQQQNRLGTAQIQQQGQALAARGQVTPAQQFASQQQQRMQGNQFAQQQALLAQRGGQAQQLLAQRQEEAPAVFTQGDFMTLSQLQAGKSNMDRQLASGDLTQEDYDKFNQQISPQIQALQKKQQMTRANKRQQGVTEGIQDQAAAMATRMAAGQQVGKALGWEDGQMSGLVNKDHPELGSLYWDPGKGELKHVTGKAPAQDKTEAGLTEKDWLDQLHKVVQHVDSQLVQKDATGNEKGHVQPEDRDRTIWAAMDARGLGQSYQDYKAKRKGGGTSTPAGQPPAPAEGQPPPKQPNPLPATTSYAAQKQVQPSSPQETPQPMVPGTNKQAPPGFKAAGDDAPGYVVPTGWERGRDYDVVQGEIVPKRQRRELFNWSPLGR